MIDAFVNIFNSFKRNVKKKNRKYSIILCSAQCGIDLKYLALNYIYQKKYNFNTS